MTTAKFKPIDKETALKLADFISKRNLNKSIEVGGAMYTLDHVSLNTNSFFRSRGFSAYFRVGKSVVRLSDHWAESIGYEKSRKLNCGRISGKLWIMAGKAEKVYVSRYAGKYPFECLAGICGLSVLNKTCDHWKD